MISTAGVRDVEAFRDSVALYRLRKSRDDRRIPRAFS